MQFPNSHGIKIAAKLLLYLTKISVLYSSSFEGKTVAYHYIACAVEHSSEKKTPCHILTFTWISQDNRNCDLPLDIPV